jgi:AraC-like DNA-binding protein
MQQTLLKEITPLTINDCFTVFSRTKKEFNFPLHFHEEYEINLIINAKGAKRIIGDHMSEINDIELVLIGPNLPHCWKTFNCKSKKIIEITIQFHKDLIDEKFLRRNQTHFIKEMFDKANKGVLFSRSISQLIIKRLKEIAQKKGFDSVLELLSILNDLSKSKNMKVLSVANYSNSVTSYNSRRIEKVIEFLNTQYDKKITLKEAAKIANMSEVSFSRFFKANTGISFIDNLIDIRLGHASRLLIDTNYSINEIAYSCGFNNISNFNRLFKKKKNYAPKKFREDYTNESRVFI